MTDTHPTMRINGPVDLLAAVPYLLGFHPTESLVLVGLTDGALVVTARLNLADATDNNVGSAIAAMVRGGSTELIGAIFTASTTDGEGLPHRQLVKLLEALVEAAGARLLDCLVVVDKLWWSYLCTDPHCCDPGGKPLPDAPTAVEAEAVYRGMTAAPTRDSLIERFTPNADRDQLRPLLVRTEQRVQRIETRGLLPLHTLVVLAKVTKFADAAAGATGRSFAADDDVAMIGAALRLRLVRASVCFAIERQELRAGELWLDLARRLPGPYDAAPLTMYGWTCWHQGNGTLAGMAAERAVAADCTYEPAQWLLSAIAAAINPRVGEGIGKRQGRRDTATQESEPTPE